MARQKAKEAERTRPALTPELREKQMISLAIDLAEQRLRDGTASSQLICHYLKLGSSREQLEKELLEKQKDLAAAKVEAIHNEEHNSEVYEKAIAAMRSYSGAGDYDDSDLY